MGFQGQAKLTPARSHLTAEPKRPRRRPASTGAVFLGSMLLLVAPAAIAAQTDVTREYQLKAAFLFNFGQFVTWLPEDLPSPESPFVIGVLGDDPFGPALDAVVLDARILEREAVVERYRDVEDVGNPQILFISSSESPRLDRIFEALAGRSILTVGDSPGFADRSGVIRFVLVGNRLRFQINTAAAAAARLTISSRLLQLADVVRSDE